MKNRMFRTGMTVLLTFAIAILVGCAKEDLGDSKAEAKKIDDGLKGQPKVPDDLATVSGNEPGAPIGKKGAKGGGP
jgi:hypothetical protein